MYACDSGSVDIAQMILKHPDVDVNGRRNVGLMPTYVALNILSV